jgi:hypothetical protein
MSNGAGQNREFTAVLWILNAVLCILAAIKASAEKFCPYSMTIWSIQEMALLRSVPGSRIFFRKRNS